VSEIGFGFQSDEPPGSYGPLARAAEAHGAAVLSVYGDLGYPPPIGPLLEMAAATFRARLGPACVNATTLHPVEIAGQAALLDRASGGRAFLGLARGAWLGRIGASGTLERLADAAAAVGALLAGRSHDGPVFPVAPGTRLHPQPLRSRMPLLIGGWGPRVLSLAGRIADEVKIGGSANPDLVPVVRERIAAGAAPAGRDPSDVAVVVGAVSVVDEDGEAARALARTEVAMYLEVVAPLDPTIDVPGGLLDQLRARLAAGDPEGAGRAVPDDLLDRFAFSGTPEQVASQAAALFAAGATRIDFGTPHGLTAARGIDLIGTRVMPLLSA
jgi:5,10-methylenetetrahydromethanopterin reductase